MCEREDTVFLHFESNGLYYFQGKKERWILSVVVVVGLKWVGVQNLKAQICGPF
jgi:hypothetical protein